MRTLIPRYYLHTEAPFSHGILEQELECPLMKSYLSDFGIKIMKQRFLNLQPISEIRRLYYSEYSVSYTRDSVKRWDLNLHHALTHKENYLKLSSFLAEKHGIEESKIWESLQEGLLKFDIM